MISNENKIFLKEKLGIDTDSISNEEINKILDKLLKYLNNEIEAKENNILDLKRQIFVLENKED
ncbi:MAG: hypothetical protein ACI4U0_01505 [Candidatus Aphodocola sp.]